jgi:hypothetical protein
MDTPHPNTDDRAAPLRRLHELLRERCHSLQVELLAEAARSARRREIKATRGRWRYLREELAHRIVGTPELLSRITMIALRAAEADEGAPRVLLTGGTGSGKSAIARAIAEISARPYLRISAAHTTESGWEGISLESLLGSWGGAERGSGIIQIDELDKVTIDGDTTGNSRSKYTKQQAHFLGLLGREPVPLSGGQMLDTSRYTVLVTGAFATQPWSASGRPPTTAELLAAGIIAELADRLDTRIAVPSHTASTLAQLYRRQLHREFKAVRSLARRLGYRLRIVPETYRYVAEAAAVRAAGPREGRGWLEAACHAAVSRALEEGRRPGVLVVSPDDVLLPLP